MTGLNRPERSGFRLSEDWIATIVGLAIVLAIAAGLIGPGPQTVKLNAKPGETATADALAVDDWSISSTIGGDKVSVENGVTNLQDGMSYAYVCQEGKVAAESELPDGLAAPKDGHALLVLVNSCDADVNITYKTSAAIPWPVFGIFKK